jgi:circadian clock protein KaiB
MKTRVSNTAKSSEEKNNSKYILQLYVNGSKPSSARAIRNAKKICEEYLDENYKLQIIDLSKHPVLSVNENIVATPTLVKKLPDPLRKLVGDLSDIDHVLLGLNLRKLEINS